MAASLFARGLGASTDHCCSYPFPTDLFKKLGKVHPAAEFRKTLLKNMPGSAGAIAGRSVKRANLKLSCAAGRGNGRAVALNVCRRKRAWGLKAAGGVATLESL